MKKFLMILIFLQGLLYSAPYSIDAKYDIFYGFFGRVGVVESSLFVDNQTYKIKINAKAMGLAKVLSRGRVERYESSGIVKDGVFEPQIFLMKKIRAGKKDIKRYLFDYDKEHITLLTTKIRDKKAEDRKSMLPFFTKNDILTLFFNLKYFIGKDFTIKEPLSLVAVGARNSDGKIDIDTLKDAKYKKISKLLDSSDHILSVVLNQKIFASQNGEMFLNLNDEGICTSAVLKDVIMFGDIRGKITKLKIKR